MAQAAATPGLERGRLPRASGTCIRLAARRDDRQCPPRSADPLRLSEPGSRDRRRAADRKRSGSSGRSRTARDRTRRRARRRYSIELGHLGPVLDEPLFLFFGRRPGSEDDLADVREPAEMALPRNRKPPHRQRARLGDAGRIHVAPGHVVLRAAREDRDLVVGGEMLGDDPAVPLGAAGHFGSETLDHAGELHSSGFRIRTGFPLAEPHQVAAEPRVLDRKLLDAGDEHPVEPILAVEIVDAVLVEPARQRQQDPALDEYDQRARHRADGWRTADGSGAASRCRGPETPAAARARRAARPRGAAGDPPLERRPGRGTPARRRARGRGAGTRRARDPRSRA